MIIRETIIKKEIAKIRIGELSSPNLATKIRVRIMLTMAAYIRWGTETKRGTNNSISPKFAKIPLRIVIASGLFQPWGLSDGFVTTKQFTIFPFLPKRDLRSYSSISEESLETKIWVLNAVMWKKLQQIKNN